MSRRPYAILIPVILAALAGPTSPLTAQTTRGYPDSRNSGSGYPESGYPGSGYPGTGSPLSAGPAPSAQPIGFRGFGYPDARGAGSANPAAAYPPAGVGGWAAGNGSGLPAAYRPTAGPDGPYPVTSYPSTGSNDPSTANASPNWGGVYPTSGDTYPPTGGAYPTTGGAYPATGDAYPTTGGAAGMASPGARPWQAPRQPVETGFPPANPYPPTANPYPVRPGPAVSGGQPAPARGPSAAGLGSDFGPRPPAFGQAAETYPMPPAGVRPPSRPASELFEPARVIARVGNEPILAGDLLPQIKRMLEPYKDKASEEELRGQEEKLLKQLLKQSIEYKLLYQDFLRSLPADKRQEILSNAEQKLFEEYDQNQLSKDLKTHEVKTEAELDSRLRDYGSSLARQKREYMEQQLARAQLARSVELNAEITHDEMLTYYRKHQDDYAIEPAAKWEQLTVKFENFESKAAAFRFIANMGNEVLRGAPFAAVARRHSQEPYASDGGLHDWTEQGSLVSVPMDRAIFSLPVGRMSQIIEDEQGFHIVRVIERREAGRVKFSEVQTEIKDTIRKERRGEEIKRYLEKLKQSIHVWNAFEDTVEQAP